MAKKSRDAVHYIVTHPGHEAELFAGRFVMLWAGGSLHPLDDFFGKTTAWFRFVLLFNLCAAAGALGAIVLLFRDRSIYALPLAAGPVVFPFAYYLTLALPRYRHPIDPTLILLLALVVKRVAIKKAASRSGGKRPSSAKG